MSGIHKSRTLSISIDCQPEQVYAFISDPKTWPTWVTSFVQSVRRTGGEWFLETPDGPVGIRFVPANDLGVLDHVVSPAPGIEILNPMRVVPNGEGSEVTFMLFQRPGMSDEQFADDAAMVESDLRTLKRVLEA